MTEGEPDNPTSKELKLLHDMDQSERRGEAKFTPEELKALEARDAKRRDRVAEIVSHGLLCSADDYYHAALILQHSGKPDDHLLAHVLATTAVFKGREGDKWLVASSLDRFLQSLGRPQIFGTQYKRTMDDPNVTQEPYERSLNDQFHREYGIPTLAEQERVLVETNNCKSES
jgi:hypothetical protein